MKGRSKITGGGWFPKREGCFFSPIDSPKQNHLRGLYKLDEMKDVRHNTLVIQEK